MKPTKNKFFCSDCGRIKALFETEKKALNFIKFNQDLIEGEKKPARAYYCAACLGWHTTSQIERLNLRSRTDRVISAYQQVQQRMGF